MLQSNIEFTHILKPQFRKKQKIPHYATDLFEKVNFSNDQFLPFSFSVTIDENSTEGKKLLIYTFIFYISVNVYFLSPDGLFTT